MLNRHSICLRLPAAAVVSILLFSLPILIHAQDSEPAADGTTEAAQHATIDFLIGNSLFVLMHEFGHVLIRDFDIPILGLEENAADTLAAVGLIMADENQSERQPRLSEYLAMAALGNVLIWQIGKWRSSRGAVDRLH